MKSVSDRLAFQGTGDEKYIEEVLYFQFRLDAYGLEQCLHLYFSDQAAFGKYSAFADMPLPRNGQSELYYDDVLNLDNKFTPAQAEATRKAVELAVAQRTYTSEVWAKRMIAISNVTFNILTALAKTIGWSIRSIKAAAGIKVVEEQLPSSIIENKNRAELFLAELRRDQEVRVARAQRELKILRLIYAFKNRDLEKFKGLANIEGVARDMASSMISDYFMLTDYMTVPNNCCMFNLMEAMNHQNCHDLLIRPVIDSYIPMVEEFITTRTITDMSIRMPDDPLYSVDPEYAGCPDNFTAYFGAQEFAGLLDCQFVARGPYKHDDPKRSVEFTVELKDRFSEKNFELQIVIDLSKKMLRFSFPNLLQVMREYRSNHKSPEIADQ